MQRLENTEDEQTNFFKQIGAPVKQKKLNLLALEKKNHLHTPDQDALKP